MIFPEGTRSRNGELLPFKDGAFRLAVEAGCRSCLSWWRAPATRWPRGRSASPRGACRHVLEPVSTEGLSLADVPALRDRVRAMLVARATAWERELAAAAGVSPSASAPAERRALRPRAVGRRRTHAG